MYKFYIFRNYTLKHIHISRKISLMLKKFQFFSQFLVFLILLSLVQTEVTVLCHFTAVLYACSDHSPGGATIFNNKSSLLRSPVNKHNKYIVDSMIISQLRLC